MTPENRPIDPDNVLAAFKEAGKVLTDNKSSEHDIRLAVVGMIGAYAFMQGQNDVNVINAIIRKKGEN